jgi:ABC-type polysaccharide/polyol phosphate export permease
MAHVLPVTHGIRLIQDIMLRGSITQLWQVGMLALIAGLMLLFSWIGLRRGMTRLV